MNFAPYQDVSPETDRALSPPPQASRTLSPPPPQAPIRTQNYSQSRMRDDTLGGNGDRLENEASTVPANPNTGYSSGRDMDVFATSLPLRLNQEACLAYLLLPPVGGAFLLIAETRSDYVRFHAWQSSLLFTFIFVFHLIFSFSKVISILMLLGNLVLIGFLAMRAYQDADTLDRWEVPVFGRLASSFVDNE